MSSNSKKRAKIMLTISDELNEKFISYSKKLGIPKTQMIIMATNSYIDNQIMLDSLPSILKSYDSMKQQGLIDESDDID